MGDDWRLDGSGGGRAYVAHNIYQNIPVPPGGPPTPGRHGGAFDTWVNLPATRLALNVAGSYPSDVQWGETPWEYPFNNDQGWDVDGYPDPTVHPDGAAVCKELDLSPVYVALSRRVKVLVFAGDIDNQVPAIGLERWVRSLALPVREGWRAWRESAEGHVAGSVVSYGDGADPATGLLFVTVRGAGHSVLRDRSQAALDMFRWFLSGERFDGPPAPAPLAPKL
jgi:hypothetical protein